MMGSLGRLGMVLLTAGFVVAIANAAARLTWTLAGQTGMPVSEIATALADPPPERALDLTPIFVLAPFGAPAVVAAAVPVAEETSLGLALHGVVVAGPQRSIAVVASDGGPAKLYGIGDSIEGRAVLKEVRNDKVLIEVGGRVETLSFAKPTENSGIPGIIPGITTGVTETTGSIPNSATPIVEEFRRKIASNPKSVLDSVGISVSQNGYMVDDNATSIVSRAGLRSGDLISKVNGEPVGDIERDRRLLDTIIASGSVRVEVVRDGRTVFMSFPLK